MMVRLHIDSSIPWLLGLQARARARRLLHGFSTPRRLLLSSVGLVLAAVYLAQAAANIWLREPMAPGRLREIVPLALLAYFLWDAMRLAWKRPKHGIRFRPEEQQQLGMAPLARADLIVYRLLAIFSASVLKAAVFCAVMVADLPIWPLGFLGALLALSLVDQLRLLTATVVAGMSDRTFRWFRTAVFLTVATIIFSAGVLACCAPDPVQPSGFAGAYHLLRRQVGALSVLGDTRIGWMAQLPFLTYGHLIAVERVTAEWLAAFLIAILTNGAAAYSLVTCDAKIQQLLRLRERLAFHARDAELPGSPSAAGACGGLPRLPGPGGWSAVAWRQLRSAGRYWPNLTLALLAPGVLSLSPLLLAPSREEIFGAVVGCLAFYTFLLLPAALKFDFRRDVDRIVALKLLPLRPWQVVVAQVTAPWVVTTVFHLVVLMIALSWSGGAMEEIVVAMVLLMPLSWLCFGLDNLIFLLYPHHLREEGLVMFVRTTLTFTAKGLFFAASLIVVAGWAYGARMLGDAWQVPRITIFLSGLLLLLLGINFAILRMSAAALRHFDINWDRP